MTSQVKPIDVYVTDRQFRLTVQLRFAEPMEIAQSTKGAVASAYPAADWPFCLVALTDGTANKFMAVSNGSAWYYMDGTLV